MGHQILLAGSTLKYSWMRFRFPFVCVSIAYFVNQEVRCILGENFSWPANYCRCLQPGPRLFISRSKGQRGIQKWWQNRSVFCKRWADIIYFVCDFNSFLDNLHDIMVITVVIFLDIHGHFHFVDRSELWHCFLSNGVPKNYLSVLRKLCRHTSGRVRVCEP